MAVCGAWHGQDGDKSLGLISGNSLIGQEFVVVRRRRLLILQYVKPL